MRERERTVDRLLREAGYPVASKQIPRPRLSDLSRARIVGEVRRLYRALGGTLDPFPDGAGRWDITVGSVAIEFDEERHFNRYRLQTLESPLYARIGGFPLSAYQSHCNKHEAACLAAAGFKGYWSNASCDRQFGAAGPPEDLGGPGSSRWKQRAFYDFLKDLSPLAIGVPVARVSVFDQIKMGASTLSIGEALKRKPPGLAAALVSLIEDRSGRSLRA